MKKTLFTIKRGHWHSWEMLPGYGGAFAPYHSPIFVHEVHLRAGLLGLRFYNAAYAEGVREFTVELRVLKRAPSYLLAEYPKQKERSVVIGLIDFDWVRRCMAEYYSCHPRQNGESIREYLERETGYVPGTPREKEEEPRKESANPPDNLVEIKDVVGHFLRLHDRKRHYWDALLFHAKRIAKTAKAAHLSDGELRSLAWFAMTPEMVSTGENPQLVAQRIQDRANLLATTFLNVWLREPATALRVIGAIRTPNPETAQALEDCLKWTEIDKLPSKGGAKKDKKLGIEKTWEKEEKDRKKDNALRQRVKVALRSIHPQPETEAERIRLKRLNELHKGEGKHK